MNLSTDSNFVAWEQYSIALTNEDLKQLLASLNKPVFFDSGCQDNQLSRNSSESINYSSQDIITGNPTDEITLTENDNRFPSTISDLNYPQEIEKVPFSAGYIGYIKYEYGNELFNIDASISKRKLKNYSVCLYTWSIVRQNNHTLLTFSPLCDKNERLAIKKLIEKAKVPTNNNKGNDYHTDINWKLSSLKNRYHEQFNKIHNYINAGDTYQVNFTQRFEAETNTSALDLYFYLRNITKTPYSFYTTIDKDYSILSFSPERFIQIKNSTIKTSPIKGTTKNNGDEVSKERLSNSEKDKAENLMIVDLLRNDLSKVSKLHSVSVEKLFSLETFQNVHHLISDIKSDKNDNITELDAFLACFPGGSITGAPKKRAMEIIKETEEHSRDAYCGSAFYWNFDGNFDSNILIRTIVKNKSMLYCWGGGGITSSSRKEDEYAESLQKVSNLTGIEPEQE